MSGAEAERGDGTAELLPRNLAQPGEGEEEEEEERLLQQEPRSGGAAGPRMLREVLQVQGGSPGTTRSCSYHSGNNPILKANKHPFKCWDANESAR